MSHYDQICVEQVVLDSPIRSDLLTESPLAQAYQHKFICYGIMGGTVTNNENQLFS